jgi:hypothetical protein
MRDFREPWLDRKGAAQYWSCSVRTVDYWLKHGMPHERMVFPGGKSAPRILPSQAEPWLIETGRLTNGLDLNQSNATGPAANRPLTTGEESSNG